MKGVKAKEKALKILVMVAILLTATILVISIQNQNKNQNAYPLINAYVRGVSQNSPAVILEEWGVSSNYTFSGNVSGPIVVTVNNILINGNRYTLQVSGSETRFYIENSFYNTLPSNTANNNFDGSLMGSASYNTLSGSNTTHNNQGFELYHGSYNIIMRNTVVLDFEGCDFYKDPQSYNNFKNNTVIINQFPSTNLEKFIWFYIVFSQTTKNSQYLKDVLYCLIIVILAQPFIIYLIFRRRRQDFGL